MFFFVIFATIIVSTILLAILLTPRQDVTNGENAPFLSFHPPKENAHHFVATMSTTHDVVQGFNGTVSLPIQDNGGSVMNKATNIITPVFYGNWSSGDITAIKQFLSDLVSSNYLAITRNYRSVKTVTYNNTHKTAAATSAINTQLATPNKWTTAAWSAILAAYPRPTNVNEIIILLTANGINLSGYGTTFCAFHTAQYPNNTQIKYLVVPYANNSACMPTGATALDSIYGLIASQLANVLTDPIGTAFTISKFNPLCSDPTNPSLQYCTPQISKFSDDSSNTPLAYGLEVGTTCAWTYGSTTDTSGRKTNVTWNGRSYLVPRLLKSNSTCGLS